MKYIIRKVPERDTTYLERLIPGAIIYSDVEHEGPIESFVRAMELADDDAVYVQDDMILCEGFYERCNKVCSEHSNSVVQLSNFTFNNDHTRILVEGYHKPGDVPWVLCIYIPKRLADVFVMLYRTGKIIPNAKELRAQADDDLFTKFMQYVGEDYWLVVPNLAGHPLNKSTVLSERDSQIRLCMNFDYEHAVTRGDMDRERKYYMRYADQFDALRRVQQEERNKL